MYSYRIRVRFVQQRCKAASVLVVGDAATVVRLAEAVA